MEEQGEYSFHCPFYNLDYVVCFHRGTVAVSVYMALYADDYALQVNAYMKGHKTYIAEGIPAPQGDFFDLTTMTAAERKKAAQPSGGFW